MPGGRGIFIGYDVMQGATGGHSRGLYIGYKLESSAQNSTVDDEGVIAFCEHQANGKGNGTFFHSSSTHLRSLSFCFLLLFFQSSCYNHHA